MCWMVLCEESDIFKEGREGSEKGGHLAFALQVAIQVRRQREWQAWLGWQGGTSNWDKRRR